MKILYVTTISNTVNTFLIPHIKSLIDKGNQVDVAFNIDQEVSKELNELGCTVYKLELKRSPLKFQNILAYKKLKELILENEYELIHTHTPVASACVRIACKNMKNVKVIYTAHGFHFYKGAPFLNWLIYYPIEWWLSKFTDILIAINKEDYSRAKNLRAKRVEYLPGIGINLNKFEKKSFDIQSKRDELGISEKNFLMLSIGELNKNKNHEVVIRALAKLEDSNVKYLICGQGPRESYLIDIIKELGLEEQVKLLGFRKDISEICNSADVFLFPSYREGLSVALMEAMATGLPIIASKIRGNIDLVDHKKGGLLLDPLDVEGFSDAIQKLQYSDVLRKRFKKYNEEKVANYSIENVRSKMMSIYKL